MVADKLPSLVRSPAALWVAGFLAMIAAPAAAQDQAPDAHGGEVNLVLPDLNQVEFLGMGGATLLLSGLVICALGLLFGLAIYAQLKRMPVHQAMREMSDLIYATCKTYLFQQGKFLLILWAFITAIILVYFGLLAPTGEVDAATGAIERGLPVIKLLWIVFFSLLTYAGARAALVAFDLGSPPVLSEEGAPGAGSAAEIASGHGTGTPPPPRPAARARSA